MQTNVAFESINANGLTLRVAVQGTGPLVTLVHGWPETWYSWRHQIDPLAAAGYRVAVPDVRGYGGSDCPEAIEAYDMASLMNDILAITDHFGEDQAILVGHDWGARICWATSVVHPERVAAVAGLSVPYNKRGAASPIDMFKKIHVDNFFYQVYFQKVGVAEAELDADVRTSLRKIYYAISGDAPSIEPWSSGPPDRGLLDTLTDPDPFPGWLTDEDFDYLVSQFEQTGFRGAVNRYRNQEKDFDQFPAIGAARITQPACFVAGSKDLVRHFAPGQDAYANQVNNFEDLRINRIVDGKGHWIQQEAPKQVNEALLEFLAGL